MQLTLKFNFIYTTVFTSYKKQKCVTPPPSIIDWLQEHFSRSREKMLCSAKRQLNRVLMLFDNVTDKVAILLKKKKKKSKAVLLYWDQQDSPFQI